MPANDALRSYTGIGHRMPGGTITLEDRIAERLPPRLRAAWLAVDESVTGFMRRYGPETLRVAVALVFIWFGALKLADRSPVADLVADTVYWVPSGFFVRFLGVWEIVVGVGLLLRVAMRIVLLLFFVQMGGTFLVLVIHPGTAFQSHNPLLLTTIGEFVIKNLVLIAAGLVIGSGVRPSSGASAGATNWRAGQDSKLRQPD